MKIMTQENPSPEISQAPGADEREGEYLRMNCLTLAVQQSSGAWSPENTIQAADKFLDYVKNANMPNG